MRACSSHELHAPPSVEENALEIEIRPPSGLRRRRESSTGIATLDALFATLLNQGANAVATTAFVFRGHLVVEFRAQKHHQAPLLKSKRSPAVDAEDPVAVREEFRKGLLPELRVIHRQRLTTSIDHVLALR